MRVLLDVPYAEKDQAKALGARWDAVKKRWFLENPPYLEPFMRWLPQAAHAPAKPKKKSGLKLFGLTQSVPMDACTCDVLPWEDCEHTQHGPNW